MNAGREAGKAVEVLRRVVRVELDPISPPDLDHPLAERFKAQTRDPDALQIATTVRLTVRQADGCIRSVPGRSGATGYHGGTRRRGTLCVSARRQLETLEKCSAIYGATESMYRATGSRHRLVRSTWGMSSFEA